MKDIYKKEFAAALNEFQNEYRASTSGDLQTFVLGLQAAVKIFENKPKKKIEISLEEFISLGGDISKVNGINYRVAYSGYQGQVLKVEYSHKNVNVDFYKVYFTDGKSKEFAHFWINVNVEFSIN